MPKKYHFKYTAQTASRLVLSGFILLLLSACSELDTHDPVYRFQTSDDLYSASMRWGEWHTLFELMKANPDNPNSKVTPPSEEQLEYLTKLKVSHVETLNTGIIEEEKTARTLYQIEYHPETSSVIKKIRHTVNWWYDKKRNQWFTDTPLPKEFKVPEYRTIKLSPR